LSSPEEGLCVADDARSKEEAMAKGQRDLREYLTAYDAREHLSDLAAGWMTTC
jgi:hypothetical protein